MKLEKHKQYIGVFQHFNLLTGFFFLKRQWRECFNFYLHRLKRICECFYFYLHRLKRICECFRFREGYGYAGMVSAKTLNISGPDIEHVKLTRIARIRII